MRKLASVQVISSLEPIPGKDRIVLATVLGWRVIVQKADYQVGDKCVYVEVDSVLPEKPEFEFLRKVNFRIKTMKMAGVISQGICFPMSILPSGKTYEIDEDVTKVLGIKQYEPTMDREPEPPQSKKKFPKFLMRFKWFRRLVMGKKKANRNFPTFVSKTDEIRIQTIPWILNDRSEWVATEKIDGQSGTFAMLRHKHPWPFKDRFEYIVCSRNLRLPKPDGSSYWSVSDRYQIESVLRGLIQNYDWIAIQGECIAPGVQGNKYKVSKPDLYVFNLITPRGRVPSEFARSIVEDHGLKFVPIVDVNYTMPETVEQVLQYAHGPSAIGETLREGIVFRSKDGVRSFKAVDPDFLLTYNE